jgi:hypothetical protein
VQLSGEGHITIGVSGIWVGQELTCRALIIRVHIESHVIFHILLDGTIILSSHGHCSVIDHLVIRKSATTLKSIYPHVKLKHVLSDRHALALNNVSLQCIVSSPHIGLVFVSE